MLAGLEANASATGLTSTKGTIIRGPLAGNRVKWPHLLPFELGRPDKGSMPVLLGPVYPCHGKWFVWLIMHKSIPRGVPVPEPIPGASRSHEYGDSSLRSE